MLLGCVAERPSAVNRDAMDASSTSAAGSSGAASGGAPAAGSSGGSGTGGSEGGAPAAGSSGGSGTDAPSCGKDSPVKCAEDEYCRSAPDSACGPTAVGAVCHYREEGCADLYHGVCGCDNRTYGNDCAAHVLGVAIKHEGNCTHEECTAAGGRILIYDGSSRCDEETEDGWYVGSATRERPEDSCCVPKPAPLEPCGGASGDACGPGEFCNMDEEGCGTFGVCEPRPTQACTRDYWPLCGCDGVVYDNACEAHAAGTSVRHKGACTDR
jgi:hypothetical protein